MSEDKEVVDYTSPLYLQLREVVRNKIEEGEYLPGCLIPSENELAKKYGINRLTVRNAIDALVVEGLVKRVQGAGTYVVGDTIERDLNTFEGFQQTMKDRNATPTIKVLDKVKRPAGPKYASTFNIDEDDEIFYIRRLRLANGEPVAIDKTYIPVSLLPQLEDVDLSVFGMYETFGFYGINPHHATETLDIIPIESSSARLLNIEKDTPIMLFTCKTYDDSNNLIEVGISLTRGDSCSFKVHNTRCL